jgi:ketosteroid isomerase-like protein
MTRWIVLAVAGLLAVGQTAQAQAGSPADSVRALDSAWAAAYATHDTALAIRLLAEDLIVTSASGNRKDKQQELGDIRPQANLRMHFFRTREVRAIARAGVVVLNGLAEWEFSYNGQMRAVRRRYTAVYARGGTLGWEMIALHLGNAPEGGG